MDYIRTTFKRIIFASISTLGGFTTITFAQEDSTFVLEEILVTARKTEESLQDVPLSISAFDEQAIRLRSIEELDDVALYTPGLSFEDYSNGGFGTPTIRGASQIAITQLEQNVSTFLDGVYIPRQYAVEIGTLNLERVEVVKGPQSALYGANAFLGAINYVSKKADLEDIVGDIGLTLGTDERQDLSGSISFPLLPGILAVRLAAGVSEFDGDWDNDFPNPVRVNPGTNGKIGGWDNSSYEIDILAQPNDALRLELGYSKFDVLSETRAQYRLSSAVGDLNCGGLLFGVASTTFCGELPETPIAPNTGEEIGFLIDPRTFGIDSETDFVSAKASYDFSDQFTLNYQYGSIQGEVFSAGNSDRDPIAGTTFPFLPGQVFNGFTQRPVGDFDYDSHELRLEFNSDGGFSGMLGAFFSDGEDFDGGSTLLVDINDPIEPITEIGDDFASDLVTKTEVKALFGLATIPLIDDRLLLTLEGRYTDESKTLTDTGETFPDFEDDYFTSRISLDYNLTDDSLLYASVAEGVKSGGINGSALAELTEEERFYDRDENTTYELGSKNTFVDGRLQLNASIYYIDWANLQISTLPSLATDPQTIGILTNLGSASSKGAEIDLTYAATDAITFNAGLALNDATYDDGTTSQRIVRLNLCADGSCPADGNLGGNNLPRSSDTQWSVGAMYEGTIGEADLDYFFRADYSGQSKQYVSELNTATVPSRKLLNLRAGINQNAWSVELWVKNAFDEEYVSNAFFIPLSFRVEYVPSFGNRRRIGLDVSYQF